MSEKHLGPIVSGEEIVAEIRRRRRKEVQKTVSGSSRKRIDQKAKLEEADGWRTVRKNAKSTRMAKAKPADERLEDEVWSMLAQMGFKEMSKGRQFTVALRDDLPRRQIDVFAKDDETAIVVQCTQREAGPLIDEIKSARSDVLRSIAKAYGRQARLKVKYAIATRNVSWCEDDLAECRDAQIAVISDGELDYYAALAQHLKHAARYQLLGHLLSGQKVDGLARKVVATRGKMGGETFYTFLIRPDELLKIAYVGHKASRDIEDLETYQRMLQARRLKKIAEYINGGGKFPTNIVVNLKTSRRTGLQFDTKERYGDEAMGVLHLPPTYGSAWIIDGQHRLYGYAYARETSSFNDDATVVPVLAYENLAAGKEMNLFIDINSKQVKVNTGLLVELYADLHWRSSDPEEAFQALLSRIASRLNGLTTSPLRDRMVVTGKKKTHFRCLTQTSIRDGLQAAKLLGTFSKGSVVPGPLSTVDSGDYEGNLRKALSVLVDCLSVFAVELKNRWEIGDGPGGYVCTNNGIRALFHVMKDVADHISLNDDTNFCRSSAAETSAAIKPYLNALMDYFRSASDQDIFAFRRIGSSLTAVRQQAWGMEAQIQNSFPDFEPAGLAGYLASRDEAGTEDARAKVMEIQKRLFDYVIGALKSEYGTAEKAWWVKGVPMKIRADCSKRWEENNREGDEESQLYLQNYVDICIENWRLVKDVVSLGARDKEDKRRNTKWIKDLNEIRNRVAHPERGALDSGQVDRVRQIYGRVEERFTGDVS